jgi:hypothetical protein
MVSTYQGVLSFAVAARFHRRSGVAVEAMNTNQTGCLGTLRHLRMPVKLGSAIEGASIMTIFERCIRRLCAINTQQTIPTVV